MTDDNDTTFQELAEAVQEIERLKAENARIAAALAEYERTEPLKKKECKGLVDQLVRMDAQLHGCYADALALNDGHEWQISRVIKLRIEDAASTAIRDLLAPTVELLSGNQIITFEGCQYYILPTEETENALSRLTALMEGKV